MSDNFLASLAGFVDAAQLAFVPEDAHDNVFRARLIQGDASLGSDAKLKNTVHYTGGIGLSVDNLPDAIKEKAAAIKTLENSGEWAVFPALETVVLATGRIRRFYAEIEGAKKLACGTNQDGMHATGWTGVECKTCSFSKKHFEGDKKHACQSSIVALVYFPELDHSAIFTSGGSSYMEAAAWLDQVGVLSKALAQRPEMQASSPGLARVNSFFFKTTLRPSVFFKSDDGKQFNKLDFVRVAQPYNWGELVNSGEVIQRAKTIWQDAESVWKKLYIDANTNAAFVQALPAAAPVAQIESRVTVAAPAPALPAASSAVPNVQAAAPNATPNATPSPALAVSTVVLDDTDESPAPITQVEMF